MKKTLYIEDELSKNIPRIIQLFETSLGKERIKALTELESDENGYGASPEEIKVIVDDTNTVEVEFRFPEALRKIIYHHDQYALFILDRNLSENAYTLEELCEIDPDYDEMRNKNYAEREGDYLFFKLGVCTKGEALKKVRFLTAYVNQEELGCRQEIRTLLAQWRIQIRDFIEKGDSTAIKKLHNEVMNSPRRPSVERKNTHENTLH